MNFIHTIRNWEFWPTHIFMTPIYLYYFLCGIRKGKKFFFFTRVNPGMSFGGLDESKQVINQHFPKKLLPKSILIAKEYSFSQVLEKISSEKIMFPLIVKPDIGLRGGGPSGLTVEKIKTPKALETYFQKTKGEPFLIQELIDLPREFGIFYIRMPWEKEGRVTSVMERKFLTVTGDGKSKLKTLIEKHPRGKLYSAEIIRRNADEVNTILLKGEQKIVVPIGNHCRGTIFKNKNHLLSPELSKNFDTISKNINGFFYGRFDIKALSEKHLEQGNVKILELNGFNSEPGHIYDPNTSLRKAYQDYFCHIKKMMKIAKYNLKKDKKNYPKIKDGIRILKKYI